MANNSRLAGHGSKKSAIMKWFSFLFLIIIFSCSPDSGNKDCVYKLADIERQYGNSRSRITRYKDLKMTEVIDLLEALNEMDWGEMSGYSIEEFRNDRQFP